MPKENSYHDINGLQCPSLGGPAGGGGGGGGEASGRGDDFKINRAILMQILLKVAISTHSLFSSVCQLGHGSQSQHNQRLR
ncbi:hypothetical protein Ddye_028808 [Dipteronia dyeriana]|uniref:Uncharacterized protein n=1 Tax=Dipteronia dyeriana TaxID=168575 RepID=A0AAD9TDL8_9ROSI|nr:hypothetical protein Ddye_028808 [Dipteronia dyeriana]